MKLLLSIFFSIFISFLVFSQSSENNTITGIFTIKSGKIFKYRLTIENYNDGKFTGFSTTKSRSNDLTKSNIEGVIDLDSNFFSFKEGNNLETNSKAADSTFCYINADKMKIQTIKGRKALSGNFVGMFNNGKVCANGTLMLMDDGFFDKYGITEKLNKETEVQLITKRKDIKKAKNNPSTPENEEKILMTSNKKLVVDDFGKNLKLEIWDGKFQDGDAVAIYLNNKLIKDKLVLKK